MRSRIWSKLTFLCKLCVTLRSLILRGLYGLIYKVSFFIFFFDPAKKVFRKPPTCSSRHMPLALRSRVAQFSMKKTVTRVPSSFFFRFFSATYSCIAGVYVRKNATKAIRDTWYTVIYQVYVQRARSKYHSQIPSMSYISIPGGRSNQDRICLRKILECVFFYCA